MADVALTKPRLAMLQQIGAGSDYKSKCGSMAERSAAKRVCMALVGLGLLSEKTERVDDGGTHPWTRWLGYEITPAGRALIDAGTATAQPDGGKVG